MRTNLIDARNNASFTQEQLAKKLGITKNAYQGYEYGTRNGSIENWLKLENILEVPVKELYKDIIEEKAVANTAMLETALRKLRK